MPYIMIKRIPSDYDISLRNLRKLYPMYFKLDYEGQRLDAQIVLYKVFNDSRKLVQEVIKYYNLAVKTAYLTGGGGEYYINVERICKELYIPVGYFIVFDVISISKGYEVFPVLPRDVKFDCDDLVLKKVIAEEIHVLMKIRRIYEAPILLSEAHLENISRDLIEGLKRFEVKDYEGSIKFFRRTCEGLKKYLKNIERIDGLERRVEEIKRLCNAFYSLLSNFGEHYRTTGGFDEALLSRDVITSIAAYIANKVITGKITAKKQN